MHRLESCTLAESTHSSGKLYALNAKTGAKLWSHLTGKVLSSPAVSNGVVYVGSQNGKVYGFGLKK